MERSPQTPAGLDCIRAGETTWPRVKIKLTEFILLNQNGYLFKHHEAVDSPLLIMLPTKQETESLALLGGPVMDKV